MAHNPLLGSRISLISKKNIRYEGTLYSINESDATVALQAVRSYGTEGREKADGTVFVAPQDAVHPYLLFRGCDIKDLHVHDNAPDIPDPTVVSIAAPPEARMPKTGNVRTGAAPTSVSVADGSEDGVASKADTDGGSTDNDKQKTLSGPKSGAPRLARRTAQMIGSGASLLNRKARGVVEGGEGPSNTPQVDFDFQSNLAEFDRVTLSDNSESEDVSADGDDEIDIVGTGTSVYQKDDFFDSISCDVLDKQNGIDNRLRGSAERSLNTETFGAVSLGNGRRGGRRYNRKGGGHGGRGGGRGGNRDSAYRAGNGTEQPRENTRWRRGTSDKAGGRSNSGGRHTYGDGGLSASTAQTTRAGGD